MNQYFIFRYAPTVVIKTEYQLYCDELTHSPFVLKEHISSIIGNEKLCGPIGRNMGGVKFRPLSIA